MFVIVFVVGAWGYHYYTEMYIPATSAKALMSLYHIPRIIADLHAYALADEMNFDKAKNALKEQCDRLQLAAKSLSGPGVPHAVQTEAVRQYFDETIDILKKACSEAQHRVERIGALMNFFTEFEKMFTVLERAGAQSGQQGENSVAPPMRTVGDLQRVLAGQIKTALEAGDEALSRTPKGLDEKTALTLMKEWEKIRPNLSVMVPFLKNLSVQSSLSLEEAIRRIPPSEFRSVEKATNELNESRKILNNIRSSPEFTISALDIVNFRSLTSISQAEISEHLFRLDRAMKELDTRY